MMYVWAKMCDQTKNIGQSFRIFDSKNKGKLRKPDFVAGFERFSIALSHEDANTLWDALDTKKRGYLVFEDFQGLTQGGSVKLMQDPYL
jgi:Ca2+-binding EF-hand superfamily protein